MARIVEEEEFRILSDDYTSDCKICQAAKIGDLDEVARQINLTDFSGWKVDLITPLFFAAGRGHLDVVQFLVELFNSNNERFYSDDDEEGLGAAAAHGHLEVVKYLVGSGVSRIDGCLIGGKTPLVYASKYGWLKVVEYLITKGAEIDAYDNRALVCACETGQLEVVKCLHRNGANIHVVQALEMACTNGHLGIVMYLHQNGVDISEGVYYWEPYFLAIEYEHPEIVAYFENPPSVPNKDRDNKICPISLCEMDASTAKLVCSKCRNVFSKDALDEWLKVSNKCPFRCSGAKFHKR